MNYFNSITKALVDFCIKVFRQFVFEFRRDLPRFFANGGEIHRIWLYSMPLKLTPKPSQINNKKIFGISIRCLRKLGWISLKSKVKHQLHSTELELQIKPRSWQGRLLLKFRTKKSTQLLAIWNRIIYDTLVRPNQPLSDSVLFFLFTLLCRFQVKFRFSRLFFLPLEPKANQIGTSWLLSADIYFADNLRLPSWLTLISAKFQHLITISSTLTQISSLFASNGRMIDLLLINDLPVSRPRHINPTRNQYYFNFENQQIQLKPRKYGGFEENFPFRNPDKTYYLLRETKDGQIHIFGFQASYPANHLQRFSIHESKRKTKPTTNQLCITNTKPQNQELIFLPINLSSFSLYSSQLELKLVDYFVADRTDFLWRPPLNNKRPVLS